MNVDLARKRYRDRAAAAALVTVASLFSGATAAEMLMDLPLCSAIDAAAVALRSPFCRVTPVVEKPGQHEVTLLLAATTSPVYVGGYRLAETDNYNGGYLPPIVELKVGDTFKVRLLNAMAPAPSMGGTAAHGGHHGGSGREINLHTHGLIVSPKNSRPDLPQNGDNVFVQLGRGQSLDYSIDIPTNLPASVLDGSERDHSASERPVLVSFASAWALRHAGRWRDVRSPFDRARQGQLGRHQARANEFAQRPDRRALSDDT